MICRGVLRRFEGVESGIFATDIGDVGCVSWHVCRCLGVIRRGSVLFLHEVEQQIRISDQGLRTALLCTLGPDEVRIEF